MAKKIQEIEDPLILHGMYRNSLTANDPKQMIKQYGDTWIEETVGNRICRWQTHDRKRAQKHFKNKKAKLYHIEKNGDLTPL